MMLLATENLELTEPESPKTINYYCENVLSQIKKKNVDIEIPY